MHLVCFLWNYWIFLVIEDFQLPAVTYLSIRSNFVIYIFCSKWPQEHAPIVPAKLRESPCIYIENKKLCFVSNISMLRGIEMKLFSYLYRYIHGSEAYLYTLRRCSANSSRKFQEIQAGIEPRTVNLYTAPVASLHISAHVCLHPTGSWVRTRGGGQCRDFLRALPFIRFHPTH